MSNLQAQVQKSLGEWDAARRRGDAAAVTKYIDEILLLQPDHPVALNARGMASLQRGDFAAAAEDFRGATASDPQQPILWINLATAMRGARDDGGERAALQSVLEIDRFDFTALLRLAELEQRAGSPKDAALAWNAVAQVAQSMDNAPPAIVDALQRARAFLKDHARDLSDQYDRAFGADRTGDPDMRRFNRCLDVILGRQTIFKNACHGVHFPFLPADEFFDKRMFPWLSDIEAMTDAIRAEALALVADPGKALRPYVKLDKGTPQNVWSGLDGSLDWGACFLWEYGQPNQLVLDRCPATARALAMAPDATLPGKAPSAFFSILRAGKRIPPHTGVTNTRAIVHLPLVVPGPCRFRVGGEVRQWVEGEAFVFDDTIEHEAANESDRDRIVLIFDTWNPHLTSRERELLAQFYALQPS